MDSVSTRRTRGDGMEKEDITEPQGSTKNSLIKSSNINDNDIPKKLPSQNSSSSVHNLNYKQTIDISTTSASLPPVIPAGKIFMLIPRLVTRASSASNQPNMLKNKEPKFVPFEPYKGAVNPIIPYDKSNNKMIKLNKNNLDLNVLVSQMSTTMSDELKKKDKTFETYHSSIDDEKAKHEKQIAELKKERDYFENQFKFQTQVNSELKNLLVAAVGEDLQTRVNVLTEDKLQLARALLNSAQNLSSHTEQIEFLAGQSEVWRSKFLASSLMVEELARWKASLSQKNTLLLSSNKQLLELTSKLRDMQIELLRNLKFLSNIKSINLRSSNIMDLTAECLNISQQLILQHSSIGMPENLNLNNLDTSTDAEKLAIEALQNSNQPLMSTDEAFKAIVGQAFPSILSMKRYSRDENITSTNTENDHEVKS